MGETTIHLLGTGNAFNSDARASQAILIEGEGGGSILVDAGPTLGLSIEQYGFDSSKIDKVFITHLHGDHIAGWPFLLLRFLFLDGRTRPLDVIGPVGVKEHLDGLMNLCYAELMESDRIGFEIRFRELPVKTAASVDCGDGISVDVWTMDHHASSLGYRFQFEERSFGITGDTRWCDNVEKMASKCDLLLLECTHSERVDSKHISLEELRDKISVLRQAGCSTLLVHTDDSIDDSLGAQPLKGVIVGQDGMTLQLG